MGALSFDPDALGSAASAFAQARDQSDATIGYLKNATLVASALGTTAAGAQFVSGLMSAREAQLSLHKSFQDAHDSARSRLQVARKMADELVAETSAVAAPGLGY